MGWDVVLLGHREVHKRRGRVVLIQDAGRPSRDAETAASLVAAALGSGVHAMNLALAAAAGPKAEVGERLDSLGALIARLSRFNAEAVVLDLATGPIRTRAQLRQVLAAARCPVMVFGAQAAPELRVTRRRSTGPLSVRRRTRRRGRKTHGA